MNREIKFRAWDKSMKKMTYPKLWDNSMPSNWEHWFDLQQFTGLLDKNGKEIYEGDVVLAFGTNIVIEEYRGSFGYFTSKGQMHQDFHAIATHNAISIIGNVLTKIEVVGNIYENPELIK